MFGCFSYYDKLVSLTTKLVLQKKRDKSDKLKYFEVYQELKYHKKKKKKKNKLWGFFFEHFLFGSFSMSIFFQTWLTSADEVGGSKKGQKHADVTLEWSLVYLYRKQTIFHEKLN